MHVYQGNADMYAVAAWISAAAIERFGKRVLLVTSCDGIPRLPARQMVVAEGRRI